MRSRAQWLELERRLAGMTPKQACIELDCCLANAIVILKRIRERDYPPSDRVIVRHLVKGGPPPLINRRRNVPTIRYTGVLKEMSRRTLQEVGQELGITRERVRQLYFEHKIERTDCIARDRFKARFNKDTALIFCMGEITLQQAVRLSGHKPKQIEKYLADYGLAPFYRHDVYDLRHSLGMMRCCDCKLLKKREHFYNVVWNKRSGRCRECSCKNIAAYNRRKKDHIFHIKLGDHYLCSGPMKVVNPPKLEWTPDMTKASVISYGQKQMYRLEWIHPDACYIDVTPVAIPLTQEPVVEIVPS